MSFQQGISGLNAASRNLEVIGNNIANANTTGAKGSRAEFGDVYATASLAQSSATPGMGVAVTGITQQFTQGSIKTTENPLDIAINGAGFFAVAPSSAAGDLSYTRDGSFQLDNKGYIVNGAGLRLQGYSVDPTTNLPGGLLGPIQLPANGVSPKTTTSVGFGLNLDARTPAPTATTPAFSMTDPSSYTSTTSSAVYDQQGNQHVLSLYFRRDTVDNTWDVYASMDGTAVPAGSPQQAVGQLAFTPAGAVDPANTGTLSGGLVSAGGTLTPGKLNLDLPFPTSTLPVAGSPSTTTAPVAVGFDNSTQFGSAFGVNSVQQDGYAPGQLTGFSVGADGTVQAQYSNGKTMPAAQVALANFRNDNGLVPVGGNLWKSTPASGQPAISAPGTANLGSLQGGALEESNVDLTQQLVDMITAQRAYQANAQTIKTQDQMLSTLVNLR
ncbi:MULTISPECIES: flagellar hook protein FlgE [Ramlibacter]|uniref:Flagellar hook protein FlgE n=1 Tax=Ramlibacter aquaticus TaxID=2780094 RepID=A0ABR9SGR0_9BURK|nr:MULTISPECIES: flagellar hook protein FlgE [Ramlibacter]MBE7941541.1 flagellar hook protein FlgE [Ramlibacter aquaticus]